MTEIGNLRVRIQPVADAATVSLRLWLRGGSRSELTAGTAWSTGHLLVEGTARRDWQAIAEESDERGMAISSFGALEHHGLNIDCLAVDWRSAVRWAAEFVLESTFLADRHAWIERQRLGELDSLMDQSDAVAAWSAAQQCLGTHAGGRPVAGNLRDPGSNELEACRQFHLQGLSQGGVLTLVGGIEEARAAAAIAEDFASFPSQTSDSIEVAPPVPMGESRRTVVLPGDQAHLVLSHSTVRLGDPDFRALEVLSVILGAGAGLSGRIPWRLREQEGLAYSAYVSAVAGAGLDPGRFVISVGTSEERIAQAEASARSEIDRLLDLGPTDQEVVEACSYLLGREPFRRETPRQIADLLARSEFHGLPFDDPRWLIEGLEKIDRQSILEVARRHLRPDDLLTTIGLPQSDEN